MRHAALSPGAAFRLILIQVGCCGLARGRIAAKRIGADRRNRAVQSSKTGVLVVVVGGIAAGAGIAERELGFMTDGFA